MSGKLTAAQGAQAALDGRHRVAPGTLNLRVPGQDRIRVDRRGGVHLIAEMNESSLTNVLIFLTLHPWEFQRRAAIAQVCDLLEAVDEGTDPVEIGHIAVLAIATLAEPDPVTWLNTLPLATALATRLAQLRRGPAS